MKKYNWDKYLVIEKEFIEAKKYVDFIDANFNTVSIFFHNEITLLGSEFETACKYMAQKTKKDIPGSIREYKTLLFDLFPDVIKYRVSFLGSNISINPLGEWSEEGKNGKWWDVYTDIKHGTNPKDSKPTLEIALKMLGIYYLILNLIHNIEAYPKDVEYYPYEWSKLVDLEDTDKSFNASITQSFVNNYKPDRQNA